LKQLGLSAVLCFLLALVLGASALLIPVAALHLVFAVGILPLIFGAMLHFVPVLTRSAAPHPGIAALPFIALLVGIPVVLAIQGILPRSVLHAAATVDLAIAGILIAWMVRRARRTLGAPHPGWRWYAASLSLLVLALLAVPPLAAGVSPLAFRLFHLHANAMGFVGLAALGTLPVLLPTALGKPDPQAAPWLRRRLFVAVAGVLFVSLGAALWWPLTLVGGSFLAVLSFGLLAHWWRAFTPGVLFADGASAALAAALAAYGALLLAGALHGTRLAAADGMVLGFGAAFLLPLVSGALSQLLPVWRFPGPNSPARQEMRRCLVRFGRLRAFLFPLAGAACIVDYIPVGVLLAAAGLLLFAVDLVSALAIALRVTPPAR